MSYSEKPWRCLWCDDVTVSPNDGDYHPGCRVKSEAWWKRYLEKRNNESK